MIDQEELISKLVPTHVSCSRAVSPAAPPVTFSKGTFDVGSSWGACRGRRGPQQVAMWLTFRSIQWTNTGECVKRAPSAPKWDQRFGCRARKRKRPRGFLNRTPQYEKSKLCRLRRSCNLKTRWCWCHLAARRRMKRKFGALCPECDSVRTPTHTAERWGCWWQETRN